MCPVVSIITPTYNSACYIESCIKSVLAQSFRDWEMLITDDCSTDDTVSIIKRYAGEDARIRLFVLDNNSGAGVARNTSLSHAQGRFIAFLDSDDLWMPDKLEKQIAFMFKKNCALSYTSYLTCNESGDITGIVIAPRQQTFFNNLCDDKIGFLTVIYDLEKVGKQYMSIIRKRQDWTLILKILKQCRIAYGMKEPLSCYRKGQQSLSKKKRTLIKYNIMVYQEVLKWPTIICYLFFITVFLPSYFLKRFELYVINR